MKHLNHQIAAMDRTAAGATGLSVEEINQLRFDAAYEYLDRVIGTDTYGLQELPLTAEFWGHWRLLWYRIDQQLFTGTAGDPPVIIDETADDAREIYLDHHEQSESRYMLNSALIDEAWHQFTTSLSKKHADQ